MKIMIVDDEIIVLQGLSKLIRDAHPDYETCCFSRAADAIAFCKEQSVDIIISDVQMPEINGLELCQEILTNSDAKVIIISGYDNFDYAVEAIKLGASRYILKPIQQKEFLEALDSTIAMQLQTRHVQKTATAAQKITLQKELSDLANGLPCVTPAYLPTYAFRVGILIVYDIVYSADSDTHHLPSVLEAYITEAALPDCHIQGFSQYQRGRFIFILSGAPCENQELCSQILSSIKPCGVDFTLAFSNFHTSQTPLLQAVTEAQLALNQNSAAASKQPVFPANQQVDSHVEQNIHILTQHYANQLVEFITAQVQQTELEKLAKTIAEEPHHIHLSPEKAVRFFEEIMVLTTAAFVYNSAEKVNSELFAHCYFRHFSLQTSFNQIKSEFIEKVIYLGTYLQSMIESPDINNHLLQQVDCIFEKNPAEISLEYVAEKLGFSPAYFSVLFKKHAGFTFKEYLMTYKINYAKSLLSTSSMSIAAIAKKLGYQNPDHFSKVFHKRMGITPSEYRKTALFTAE